jgi:hypothetical protein
MPGILQDIGKALPTIGAIGLPVAADVLSGGLALPADAALSAAGGALGKAGENLTQGKSAIQANDITAGAEAGGGALLGGAGGAVLGKLGSTLSNPASDMAASSMMRQAGGALDRNDAGYLVKNGIYNFDEASSLAPQITGGTATEGMNPILSKAVSGAVKNATNPVDLSDAFTNWEDSLIGHEDVTDTTKSNIANTIYNVAKTAGGKNLADNGTIQFAAADPIQPGNAFAASQKLRSFATKAGQKPSGAAAKDVYNNLARQIEDKLFAPDPATGETAIPITDEDKASLKEALSGIGKSNPKLYDTLSQQVDNAQSWADIRSAQQPFVKVNQATKAAQATANKTPGPSVMDTASTNPLRMAANALKGSKGANRAETNVLGRLSSLMGNKNAPHAAALLGGMAGAGLATTPNFVQGNNNMQPTAAMAPGQGQQDPYQTQMNPTGPSPVALQGAAGLIGLLNPYADSQSSAMINAAVPQLQRAQTAEAVLQAVEQAFNQAGGGQGPVAGQLAQIGGNISGGAPLAYQQSTQQLSPLLAQLGIKNEPMPSLGMQPGAAQTQFGNIQQLLSSVL